MAMQFARQALKAILPTFGSSYVGVSEEKHVDAKRPNRITEYNIKKPVGVAILFGSHCAPVSFNANCLKCVRMDLERIDVALAVCGFEVMNPCLDDGDEVTLTHRVYEKTIDDLRHDPLLGEYSTFLFYFSGHGVSRGILLSETDDDNPDDEIRSGVLSYKKIAQKISSIPETHGRPKIFIFDCCRTPLDWEDCESVEVKDGGKNMFSIDTQKVLNAQKDQVYPPPDSILCFAVTDNQESRGDTGNGSWYTVNFSNVLRNLYTTISFSEIVHETHARLKEWVKERVEEKKKNEKMQLQPVVEDALNGRLILHAKASSARDEDEAMDTTPAMDIPGDIEVKGMVKPHLKLGTTDLPSLVMTDHVEKSPVYKSKAEVQANLTKLGEGVKVFICYAPDPDDPYSDPGEKVAVIDQHEQKIWSLTHDLERHGFYVSSDLNMPGAPDSILRWVAARIDLSDYVILVCSPALRKLVTASSLSKKVKDVRAKRLFKYSNAIYGVMERQMSNVTKLVSVILDGCYDNLSSAPCMLSSGRIYRLCEAASPRKFDYDCKNGEFEALVCRMAGIDRALSQPQPEVTRLPPPSFEGPSRGSGSDAMYRDWASKPRRGYQTVPSKLSQVDPAPSSHLPSGLKGWSGYQPPPSQPGYQHPHSQPGYQPPSQSGYYQAPHGYGQTAPGFETVSYGSPLPVAASHPHRSAALVPPAAEESLSHYSYSVSDDYAASQYGMHEPFSTSEIRLFRQVSRFGFGLRIIGGKEYGSEVTVGAIVAGGAADLDGRLQIGDEIAYINGRSVLDASYCDVMGLMGTASTQGELVLSVRRKIPMPESVPVLRSEPLLDSSHHLSAPTGIREVVIDRPNLQTVFGFVLQSNILHAGCMICRLIPDSPASKCQQLYLYDEVLAVNGQDVSTMDQGDIVTLIKSSGTTIRLTVQQPEDPELVERQQMYHGQEPPLGQLQYRGPDQGDGRRQFQDFGHGYQYDEEVGSPISTDFEDIGSDDEEIQHIDIDRDERGFGFGFRGGAEYNAPLCVLRIADHGAAMNDGRLRVGDELLEINGNPTEGMLHLDAITIVKHGGDRVRLIVKRVNEQDESVLQGHHIGVDMDIIAEKTFVIGSDACILNFKGCGVKLHVPQNSLPADCQQCELKIRASLSGNFKLPSNCVLVSGVYCIQCPVKFTKDVTVEVQHCCTQTEKLTFVRAESTKKALDLYLFQILKGGKFPEGSTHGSIELSAFSYIGIVWERITEWLFPPRLYKANMYRSFTDKNNTWILYFTIIKELELEEKDFPKVLEKDVMRKIHDVVIQTFPIKFNDDRIELDHLNCNDHWQLTTELHPVIFQETVDKYKGQAGGIIPYIRINVKFSGGETESTLSRTIILRGVPEHHAHRSFLLTLECNEPITYHSVPPVLLPSRPSLEECISSTGIDRVLLDEQVTDTTHIADIADKFTQWRAMCPFLGIKESEKEVIEAAGDLSEQRRKLLTMWTQKYGPRATYRHLCTILWKHSRIDLVEAICEMVKSQLQ